MNPPDTTLRVLIPANEWLSANHRLHRMEEARRTKLLRHRGQITTRAAQLPTRPDRTLATILVGYPTARRADPGNAYPTIKAVIDGAVDAGLLPDDNAAHLALSIDRDPDKSPPGHYRLTFNLTTIERTTP